MHTYVRTLYQSTASRIFLCRCWDTGRYIVLRASSNENNPDVIQILRQNPHPNVISYLQQQNSTSGNQIAMEYVPGGDLFRYVEKNYNDMTSDTIRRMISEICRALAQIHSLGIAHRDISLENILLNDNLSCHLTHFQLAKTSASNIGGVVGKFIYMAPEMFNNNSTYDGYQADIWSFGILCFILLTGSPLCEVASSDNASFQRFSQLGVKQLVSDWEIPHLTEEAVDFLQGLLIIHPNQRLTIQDVASHPYILNN